MLPPGAIFELRIHRNAFVTMALTYTPLEELTLLFQTPSWFWRWSLCSGVGREGKGDGGRWERPIASFLLLNHWSWQWVSGSTNLGGSAAAAVLKSSSSSWTQYMWSKVTEYAHSLFRHFSLPVALLFLVLLFLQIIQRRHAWRPTHHLPRGRLVPLHEVNVSPNQICLQRSEIHRTTLSVLTRCLHQGQPGWAGAKWKQNRIIT